MADELNDTGWDFLTSHALALVELTRRPDITIRALALELGRTERHTHRILTDLVEAGYVERRRVGRRNTYELDPSRPLRHRTDRPVGQLLAALAA